MRLIEPVCRHCQVPLGNSVYASHCPSCKKPLKATADYDLLNTPLGALVKRTWAWLRPPIKSRAFGNAENAVKTELDLPVAAPTLPVVPKNVSVESKERNWFYLIGGKPCGPVTIKALREALLAGELGESIYVFREGLQTWQHARNCSDLIPHKPASVTAMEKPQPAVQPPVPLRVVVKVQGELRGPWSVEELQKEIAGKRISLSDLAQKEGTFEWTPLHQIPGILDMILPPLPESLAPAATPEFDALANASPSPPASHVNTPPRLDIAASTQSPPGPTTAPERRPTHVPMESFPTSAGEAFPFDGSKAFTLATPRNRLFAQLAEALMAGVLGGLAGGVMYLLGATSDESLASLILVFSLLWIVGNSVLLAKRGQTIGKLAFGLKIVPIRTRCAGGAWLVVLRYLPIFLLGCLSNLGAVVSILYSLAVIADSLCIFRTDRRCLHDFLAGTVVVQIKPLSAMG